MRGAHAGCMRTHTYAGTRSSSLGPPARPSVKLTLWTAVPRAGLTAGGEAVDGRPRLERRGGEREACGLSEVVHAYACACVHVLGPLGRPRVELHGHRPIGANESRLCFPLENRDLERNGTEFRGIRNP